jgi:protein SCO1
MKRAGFCLLLLLACTGLRAEPAADVPSASLYQLDAALTNQDGKGHGLDVYRGHPVLVTMFYGSCPASCPLIIDTLRATEKDLTVAQRADLRVLMISIDPARDTPASLKALAEQRRIDTTRWTLARADDSTVRTIAALLNLQYRKLPDGEFNHSTVIALLTPQGEIEASSSKLGTPDAALLAQLRN